MIWSAVHWTREHPRVTHANHARLDRIERHLRTLIRMGVQILHDRLTPELLEAADAEAEAELAPLGFGWLSDLLQFTEWEAEAADQARLDAIIRAKNG